MQDNDLHARLEAVCDQTTFMAFVQALAMDRKRATEEWENNSIEDFLESALAWAEDSDFGTSQGIAPSQVWRRFAVFLYCGKIYE